MSFKEKILNTQINLNQFYTLGIICFSVIAVANIFTMFSHWSFLDLAGKVSSTFGVIFNIGLIFFFKYLKNTLPKTNENNEAPEDIDFDKVIEQLED